MKAIAKVLFACSVVFLLSLFLGNSAIAQEMTMKEYRAQIDDWAQREADAKSEIAKCDTEIESLKSQEAELQGQINDVWSEIYSEIGVSEADVDAYRQELNDIEQQLDALGALSPEELFKRRQEIDDLEAKLQGMKGSRIYVLSEMRDKIAALEGKIATLRATMPKGMYDDYTVTRGDYLWRISAKPSIYGAGIQWYRIYSYNRDSINDPDLIHPDQILKIHRENGPNEYLVSRGDNLARIAGSMDVMGDPTKWRALYDANRSAIGDDPNLIYPYSVLKVPR